MIRRLTLALSALLLLALAATPALAQDAKADASKQAKAAPVVETEDDKKNLEKHNNGDDVSDEDMERLRALGYVE